MSEQQPKLEYVNCMGAGRRSLVRRMAWWEWNATGDPEHPHVIICAHGLSRQGRDFDVLARRLSQRARVICPDIAGRGQSDWLRNRMAYQITPTYVTDIMSLLLRLQLNSRIDTLDWIGTSMGGLIGMLLASMSNMLRPPIRRLLLNDVGPVSEWSAIERIRTYMALPSSFASVEEGARILRGYATGFGPHTDAQWLELSRHMLRQQTDGTYTLHFDPGIVAPLKLLTPATMAIADTGMWEIYDRVRAQTLLLRGQESDLLSVETAHAMAQRGPCARLVEIPGVGHAPTFVDPEQTAIAEEFIFAPD